MNLDQKIRAWLDESDADPKTNYGGLCLADAIRAVLDLLAMRTAGTGARDQRSQTAEWLTAGYSQALADVRQAIAAQLGITEKQDETDTTADESPCPTCQSLNVIGTKSYWTCTCDYGTTAQDPPGSDPNCPVHQQPAGLTINDPIELTPEQFNELRQAWLDRNPELPAGAPPLARYARMIDRLTMQTGPVQPRTRVINRDEEASQ